MERQMASANILIVEDEAIVALDLENRLEGMGYQIAGKVTNGKDTLEKIAESNPSLVLMDIKLAGEMDGITVAQLIRERWGIPVIFLTAYSDEATLRRARISEPFGYIIKPVKDRELHATIEMGIYKHKVENKLQQYSQELERRVEERTADLVETTKKLEYALQVKTSFMQLMSHELRTPLNAVLGFSEMLSLQRAGSLTEKQARYVESIHSSGVRLLEMVNNVLELTEIASGEMVLTPTTFLISDLLAGAISQFSKHAQAKNIQLDKKISDPTLTITADAGRLERILQILLDNAIKFTPENGHVTISTFCNSAGEIEITVSDNGIGIGKADQEVIFKIFEQAGEPLTRTQEGSGLGLALAKGLVELHNGRIWFESQGVPGKGSQFHVALPGQR